MTIQYIYPDYIYNSSLNDIKWRRNDGVFVLPSGLPSTDPYAYSLSGIQEGTLSPNDNTWIQPYVYENNALFLHSTVESSPRSSYFKFGESLIKPDLFKVNVRVDSVSGEVYGLSADVLSPSLSTIGISPDYYLTNFQSGVQTLSIEVPVINQPTDIFSPIINLRFYQPSGNVYVPTLNQGNMRVTAMDCLVSGENSYGRQSVGTTLLGGVNLTYDYPLTIYDDVLNANYIYNKKQLQTNTLNGIDEYREYPCSLSTRAGNVSAIFSDHFPMNEGSGNVIYSENGKSGLIQSDTIDSSGIAWFFNRNQCSGGSGTIYYNYLSEGPYNAGNFTSKFSFNPKINGVCAGIGTYYNSITSVSTNALTYQESSSWNGPADLVLYNTVPSGDYSIFCLWDRNPEDYSSSYREDSYYGGMRRLNVSCGSDMQLNIEEYQENSVYTSTITHSIRKIDGSFDQVTSYNLDVVDVFARGFYSTYQNSAVRLYGINRLGLLNLVASSSSPFTRFPFSGNLTINSDIPCNISEVGITASGLSSSDLNTLQNYIYKPFNQTGEKILYHHMPELVKNYNNSYNVILNDPLYVSGDLSLNSIPSGSVLNLDLSLEYTGNNPSGLYINPYIVRNSKNFAYPWTPYDVNSDGLRIFPESGVHNVVFSGEWKDYTENSLQSAELWIDMISKATHSEYNGGDLKIYSKNLSSDKSLTLDPLEIARFTNLSMTSRNKINEDLNMFLICENINRKFTLFLESSKVKINNSANLYTNSFSISNRMNLFIKADRPSLSKSMDMFTDGIGKSSERLTAFLKCEVESINKSFPITIESNDVDTLFKTLPMFIYSTGKSNQVYLYIKNDEQEIGRENDSTLYLTLGSSPTINNTFPLLINNSTETLSASHQMYTVGAGLYEGSNIKSESLNLFIQRNEGVEITVPMFIGSPSGESQSMDMIVGGADIKTNAVNLTTDGRGIINDFISIITHGF